MNIYATHFYTIQFLSESFVRFKLYTLSDPLLTLVTLCFAILTTSTTKIQMTKNGGHY